MAKIILFSLFFFASSVCALEIPLTGAMPRDKKTSSGIVSVDMDAVFNAHPKTAMYKQEIKNFANTRKAAIEQKVKEYDELNSQLKEITQKIDEAKASENQAETDALAKRREEINAQIAGKKSEITDLSRRTKKEIIKMEEDNSLVVLKEIEEAVKEVSKKYGGEVAIEKQNVLFSGDNAKDITGEVIIKLKETK